MVNTFQPLASDIHDWNTIPWIPPPTGAPVVVFDIPSLGAGASQVLIPAQAGFQIQLTQLYVYYPASNGNSSLTFESADALDVALAIGANTDVNEVVGAGTLLLAADVDFRVTNPGAGAAAHLQGWVTYSYVTAPPTPLQLAFTVTNLAAQGTQQIGGVQPGQSYVISRIAFTVTVATAGQTWSFRQSVAPIVILGVTNNAPPYSVDKALQFTTGLNATISVVNESNADPLSVSGTIYYTLS